jgi:hypothetical protein
MQVGGLGKVGIAALLVVGVAISLSFLGGMIAESVWLIEELGWWGVVMQIVPPLVALSVWGSRLARGWWEDWQLERRYGALADAQLARVLTGSPTSVWRPARGSFAALVTSERQIRERA